MMLNHVEKAAVIGWPIDQSRSPLIHNYWLAQQGLSGQYEAIAVSPDNIESFLTNIKDSGFSGFNVTIPYKQTIIPFLDKIDPSADKIGAVNTVWLDNGDLCGTNSDWSGFLENLDAYQPNWDRNKTHAIVLGAGGAARGVIYALLKRNFKKVTVANRTVENALKIQRQFGRKIKIASFASVEAIVDTADLLVNTTSLGMNHKAPFPLRLTKLRHDCLVSDIVYTPIETSLLKFARERGNPNVDGLGMLLYQAKIGSKKWFGGNPQVTQALRRLVLKDLGQ